MSVLPSRQGRWGNLYKFLSCFRLIGRHRAFLVSDSQFPWAQNNLYAKVADCGSVIFIHPSSGIIVFKDIHVTTKNSQGGKSCWNGNEKTHIWVQAILLPGLETFEKMFGAPCCFLKTFNVIQTVNITVTELLRRCHNITHKSHLYPNTTLHLINTSQSIKWHQYWLIWIFI